jgi:7,8-dihydropterin-6-yl-methyl-4-(beta-D-ribofuranosyl)aminobenzene 5'-phosphate synthase
MVRRADQIGRDKVYLVMGGFHLGGTGKREIESIIADFRRLGVQKAGPCHCTGGPAIEMFAGEYGDHFIEIGGGKVLDISP